MDEGDWLAEGVGLALLVVVEQLAPAERLTQPLGGACPLRRRCSAIEMPS